MSNLSEMIQLIAQNYKLASGKVREHGSFWKEVGAEKAVLKAEKSIELGKLTLVEITEAYEAVIAKMNRTKHTFSTLNELRTFQESNDCGQMWDENGVWCVYCYAAK